MLLVIKMKFEKLGYATRCCPPTRYASVRAGKLISLSAFSEGGLRFVYTRRGSVGRQEWGRFQGLCWVWETPYTILSYSEY